MMVSTGSWFENLLLALKFIWNLILLGHWIVHPSLSSHICSLSIWKKPRRAFNTAWRSAHPGRGPHRVDLLPSTLPQGTVSAKSFLPSHPHRQPQVLPGFCLPPTHKISATCLRIYYRSTLLPGLKFSFSSSLLLFDKPLQDSGAQKHIRSCSRAPVHHHGRLAQGPVATSCARAGQGGPWLPHFPLTASFGLLDAGWGWRLSSHWDPVTLGWGGECGCRPALLHATFFTLALWGLQLYPWVWKLKAQKRPGTWEVGWQWRANCTPQFVSLCLVSQERVEAGLAGPAAHGGGWWTIAGTSLALHLLTVSQLCPGHPWKSEHCPLLPDRGQKTSSRSVPSAGELEHCNFLPPAKG